MIPFAVLTGPLPKAGVVALAVLVAAVLLAGTPRRRGLAMLAALGLAPALLLAEIWHSPQLGVVHRHPLVAAGGAVVALVVLCAVAVVIARRPWVIAPLVVATLPFRVPIESGGTTSNLLVPLYLVVAAGSLAFIADAFGGARRVAAHPPRERLASAAWLRRLLAAYVALYAIQSIYSPDFEKALQQMVFFYVPFALVFCLLERLEWSAQLVRRCLVLVVALAVAFAGVGFAEYATKTVFWNPKLIAENDLHAYFTVNSVFFDPDIFGRFLALVMITLVAVLIHRRRTSEQLGSTVVLGILWAGLVLTLSRSSLGALLVGMGVLAALRWKAWPVLVAAVAVIAIGAAAVAISPKTFGLNQGLNGASAGRAGLVSGGFKLFRQRPVWGYGSGAFEAQYRKENPLTSQTLSASHTIPITIAAEQGAIGEVVYLALVIVAALMLTARARSNPARAAIAAAFLALVFHTLLYADFLEDPVTWTLLGIGTALAYRPRLQMEAPPRSEELAALAA